MIQNINEFFQNDPRLLVWIVVLIIWLLISIAVDAYRYKQKDRMNRFEIHLTHPYDQGTLIKNGDGHCEFLVIKCENKAPGLYVHTVKIYKKLTPYNHFLERIILFFNHD